MARDRRWLADIGGCTKCLWAMVCSEQRATAPSARVGRSTSSSRECEHRGGTQLQRGAWGARSGNTDAGRALATAHLPRERLLLLNTPGAPSDGAIPPLPAHSGAARLPMLPTGSVQLPPLAGAGPAGGAGGRWADDVGAPRPLTCSRLGSVWGPALGHESVTWNIDCRCQTPSGHTYRRHSS